MIPILRTPAMCSYWGRSLCMPSLALVKATLLVLGLLMTGEWGLGKKAVQGLLIQS